MTQNSVMLGYELHTGMIPNMADSSGGGLPIGEHDTEITSVAAERTASNPNNGKLVLGLKIISGQFAGTVGALHLNLFRDGSGEKDAQTVMIAQKRLLQIAICGGMPVTAKLTDAAKLVGMKVKTVWVPQKGDNADKYTELQSVKALDGSQPFLANGAPAAQPSAPPAQPAAAPSGWSNPAAPASAPAPGAQPWAQPATQPPAPPTTQPAPAAGGGWGPPASGGPTGGW